ncbi:MAG: thiamine biosynthesis protein, partial [Schumannella sp.]|nr:thiamine biosynthesis protein [Schumannella sp.]
MRHVFDTMGTTVSLSANCDVPIPAIEQTFEGFDRRFSLYRPESQLSRVAAGKLRLEEAGTELLTAYAEAIDWRRLTDGAFSPHRPDGVIDLNGIAKASAMRDAAGLLDASAAGEWTLVVGGDLVQSAASDVPRAIGIVDPLDRSGLLCTVLLEGGRRAVATSGSAERGDHIWLGGETGPADFLQVTVLADDIVTADVLATAIVAAGRAGLDDICDRWPIDVLTVDREGLAG